MSTPVPRHVVCILGRWKNFDALEEVLREPEAEGFSLDEEFSILTRDPRMKRAFEVSVDRVSRTFTDDDERSVLEHTAVAYVLSPPLTRDEAQSLSARTLRLVARLFDAAGAVAVKGDSAGIAHGRAAWMNLARRHDAGDALARAAALASAWVRRPLGDEDRDVVYSCGMHLLGEPDVEVPATMSPLEAVRWIDALTMYQLSEAPPEGIRDGETFRPSDTDVRRKVTRVACERYEDDDFFFNPYGYYALASD